MAYILQVDTSGEQCLIALSQNGILLDMSVHKETRSHASVINSMAEAVLSNTGISMQELDAIAVIAGPGSYTGLRIGMATVKAWCYVLDKPLLVFDKLTLFAMQARIATTGQYMYYGSLLPARTNEYFMVLYTATGTAFTPPAHYHVSTVHEILDTLQEAVLLAIPEENADYGIFIQPQRLIDFQVVDKVDTAYWAKRCFEVFSVKNYTDPKKIIPMYLKEVFINKKQ